ncbi:MAG: hypothetical protein CVU01_02725 [Bacteroidetes bacterium HGW-Bacteroidetes-18]|nr:MAG: hypothetical protein CVU01_02725 [Bacteroidetes bacterium HGW-Bacteroidetes-18]
MGNVNPTLRNRVRYTLKNKNFKPLEITEPIGWKDDDKEFAKIKGYDGMFTNFSNSLKFIGEGKDYILLVDALEDINGDIRLTKDVRHPKTDKWERSYDGFLDLSTLEEEDNFVTVKFNASGLEKLIKSRESEQLELERTDTLDGVEIGPILPKKVALNGRKIFLKSLLEVLEVDKVSDGFRRQASDGYNEGQLAIPVTINYESDDLIHTVQKNVFEQAGHITTGQPAGMFYANNNKTKDLKINIKVTCKIKPRSISASNIIMRVDLVRYGGGEDFNLLTRTPLYVVPNPYNMDNHIINVDYTTTNFPSLLAGESLGLYWYGSGNFSGALFNPNDYLYVDFEETVASINIEEDSFYEKSISNVLLPYEVCNRLLQIITGRTDALYSEALGRTDLGYAEDGPASLIGMTHGHWIRDFQEGDELYKKFTTSLKDFFTSFLATHNLTVGIEKIGFKERIRIEEKKFFYNRNVTIKLGKVINGKFEYIQVNKVKRSKVIEHYYSSLEVGYEKGGEYEEINGLWEYNAKSTFTTPINRLKNPLQILSKYRADLIGQEIARRKPKKDFPTEDTNYDKDIFLNDLKRGITDVFEQRVWTDDFDQQPTGTYDPESATNLRLSPFNMLLRHGSTITSGLTKNLSEFIRYGSTTGNSNLKTKLIGKPEYAENGNIEISKLEKARFVPTLIKFEYPVDFEMTQILVGSSVILGKTIPNVYGLVAFKNEKGEIEKGYLDNLKPNNKGNWEILKFNK